MCIMCTRASYTCPHTRCTLTQHKHAHLHATPHVHTWVHTPMLHTMCVHSPYHTFPQHTKTHSIHMYCVFIHPHNTHLHTQILRHTPCLHLQRCHACVYITVTKAQIPQTMCPQCCPCPQAQLFFKTIRLSKAGCKQGPRSNLGKWQLPLRLHHEDRMALGAVCSPCPKA